MDEQTPEMIETKQLIEKLEAMESAMNKQASERHRVNGVLHSTLNTTSLKLNAQDAVLEEIKDGVARIERCLLGDEKFKQVGLIATVLQLDVRMTTLESQVKAQRWAAFIAFSVLAALGGIITWLKGTGVIKFFTSP